MYINEHDPHRLKVCWLMDHVVATEKTEAKMVTTCGRAVTKIERCPGTKTA